MMTFIILYFIIGIAITELTASADLEYDKHVHSDYIIYFIEIITWLPDLFDFSDDDENLGY